MDGDDDSSNAEDFVEDDAAEEATSEEEWDAEEEDDSADDDDDEEEEGNDDNLVAFPAASVLHAALTLASEDDIGCLVFLPDDDALFLTDQSGPHLLRFVDALEQHHGIRGLDIGLVLAASDEEGAGDGNEAGDADAQAADAQELDAQEADDDPILAVPGRQQVETLLMRLFGDVLPNHSSLRTMIRLHDCSSSHIELFAAAFPSLDRPLRFLHVEGTVLQPSCVAEIVRLVRRNVQIGCLDIKRCGLDAGGCTQICDSVVDNEHMMGLSIWGEFDPGTFVKALSKESQLKELYVTAKWTVEAFVSLVECLKTNVVLERLVLMAEDASPSSLPFELVKELVTTYNITLRGVLISPGLPPTPHPLHESILDLLRRNEHLRTANAKLQMQHYRVAPDLLPEAMERFGRVPTLLYRLVRRGNLESLAEQIRMMHERKRRGYNLRSRGSQS